mgnify:CR=1 FL=1
MHIAALPYPTKVGCVDLARCSLTRSHLVDCRSPLTSQLPPSHTQQQPSDPRVMAHPATTFSLSSHALDTTLGRPAANLQMTLARQVAGAVAGTWEPLATVATNSDGRVPASEMPPSLEPGLYQLTFQTGAYFAAHGVTDTIYPFVQIAFETRAAQHYHIPLLLSPFAYSTYRGS